ncbi:MAG TPA: hypothetical protein DHV42_03570, partial [Lachnospiraceae bacterium]|nr:hypothetical protein [Lachnospiraceae bacterium]
MRIFLTPIGGFSYMAERVKNRIWRDTKLETAQELLERGLAEDSRGKDNCINVRRSTFDRVTGDYVRMESGGEKRIIKRTGRKTAEKSFLTSAVPVMEESFIPEPGGGNTGKWGLGRRQEPGKKGLRKQTPFERYVGQTFAVKTGLKFTDSASVRFKRIGRNAAVLPASLLNRTEAGRGMQKVNKTIRYATGAVAAAGAAGSLVSATAILAGSAGNIASYGIRYLKGIDGPKASMMSVQSAVEEKIGVVKGAHAISFSEKNISRRMKELKRKYPSTRGLDGTMMPGLVERFVIVREVRGKRIESIDLKLLNSNIREIKSAARNGSATKEMLLNLEGMKELKVIVRSRTFRANMGRFMRRSGSALNAAGAVVTAMIGSSDNPSMRGLVTAHQALCVMRSFAKMAVRTGKTGSVAGKLLLETKPVRAVGRKAKRAGQRAGRQAGEVLLRFVGTDYNTIHAAKTKYIGRLRSELNGGIYSRVSGTGIGKVTHRLGEGAGAAIRKASKPLHPVKRAASRITNGLKRTARIVSKPVRLFGAVMSKLTSGVRMLMKWAAVIFGIICLALFLFMIIGTFFIGFTQMIDTDTENLQNYVDYISEQNREWFEGKLEDSTADVSGVRMSLNEVYDKGGNQKGKYRIVTTNFVDQYGRKVDSSDNIKEILAMVSVKTINTWPDNWDLVDLPWGADKWTVNEVKDMIRHLYAASHSWNAVEKGPYIYYKEVNKKDARLLKPYAASEYRHVYYPSDYQTKTLLGDAEGEACEGPRNFFCTEDSIPDSASEYRKEMDASYCARGGCEVDYSGYGTYDAATDTFVLDGRLHDGTKELGNASTQAWANTDIRTRREKAQQYENAKCSGSPVPVSGDDAAYVIAGSGDELMPAHGLDFHSRVARNRKTAPSGWIHYDRKFSKYAHGDSSGYMGNAPHASCTGYRRV